MGRGVTKGLVAACCLLAAAEVFTTFDGRPIPDGVLARLPETRVIAQKEREAPLLQQR